jgi:homoserine acetyltransferase
MCLQLEISSDFLFPAADPRFLADNVEGAEYVEIDSMYGHDGFPDRNGAHHFSGLRNSGKNNKEKK